MENPLSKWARQGEQLFCEAWKAASKPLTAIRANSCNKPLCPAGVLALAGLPCGVCVTIRALEMVHDKADQLRRMGIREGAQIALLNGPDPLLLRVDQARIAISQELGKQIIVEAV